jgi:hypothetical protein
MSRGTASGRGRRSRLVTVGEMRVVGSLGQYVMGCQVGSKGTKDGDVVVPRQSRNHPVRREGA